MKKLSSSLLLSMFIPLAVLARDAHDGDGVEQGLSAVPRFVEHGSEGKTDGWVVDLTGPMNADVYIDWSINGTTEKGRADVSAGKKYTTYEFYLPAGQRPVVNAHSHLQGGNG